MNSKIARLSPVSPASLGLALALAAASFGAAATTLNDMSYNGMSGYINNLNGANPTASNSAWMGAVQINDGSSTFWAYCIDPKTNAQWGVNAYSVASLNSFMTTPLNNTNPATTGYQQQMNSSAYTGLAYTAQNTTLVQNSLASLFSHAYDDSLLTATKAAAFQYAVWEIMGESSYGRTAGALKSAGTNLSSPTDGLDTQIDAYLSALSSNSWSSVNGKNLAATTSYQYTIYFDPAQHNSQNFIKVDKTPGGDNGGNVPEPASLALIGVALAGGAFARRRAAARA